MRYAALLAVTALAIVSFGGKAFAGGMMGGGGGGHMSGGMNGAMSGGMSESMAGGMNGSTGNMADSPMSSQMPSGGDMGMHDGNMQQDMTGGGQGMMQDAPGYTGAPQPSVSTTSVQVTTH